MSTADRADDRPQDQAGTHAAEDTASGAEGRPGALLLAARRAQGLSIGDVARQLKLSVRQVEALEQDDYSAFPGPVFVRGFLRNYAKLLRLDADGVATLAHLPSTIEPPLVPQAESGGPPEPAPRSARTALLLGGVVLLVLLGLVVGLRGGKDRQPDRTAAMAPPGLPGAAVSPQHADSPPPASPHQAAPLEAPGTLPGTLERPAAPAEPAVAAPEPATPPLGAAPPLPPVPAAEPAEQAPAQAAEGAAEKRELRLAFQEESWVQIRDGAGSVIFSRLNLPGSERIIRGTPPLSLVIGNAHGVTLSYRGKAVDLEPHTRVDVARLVLE